MLRLRVLYFVYFGVLCTWSAAELSNIYIITVLVCNAIDIK